MKYYFLYFSFLFVVYTAVVVIICNPPIYLQLLIPESLISAAIATFILYLINKW